MTASSEGVGKELIMQEMIIISLIPAFIGVYIKAKSDDVHKYKRAVLVNVSAFALTGLATCLFKLDTASEWGLTLARTGIGPTLVVFFLYRIFRLFSEGESDWGCLSPFFIFIQLVLIFAFSGVIVVPILEGATFLAAILFVCFMMALGLLHAWWGPILAGLNLSRAIIDLAAGKDQSLITWGGSLEWLSLDYPVQWVILILSTLMSLTYYWERLLPEEWFSDWC